MIDIRSNIDVISNEFIYFYDFLDRVREITGESTDIACQWIMNRFTESHKPLRIYEMEYFHKPKLSHVDGLQILSSWITSLIAKNSPQAKYNPEDKYLNSLCSSFLCNCGFKREDIINLFPEIYPNKNEGDYVINMINELPDKESQEKTSTIDQNIVNENQYDEIQWNPDFAGRTHALKIIAALSRELARKTGNKFLYGENISASALANVVVEQLNEGDPQQYRKLISQALKETSMANND